MQAHTEQCSQSPCCLLIEVLWLTRQMSATTHLFAHLAVTSAAANSSARAPPQTPLLQICQQLARDFCQRLRCAQYSGQLRAGTALACCTRTSLVAWATANGNDALHTMRCIQVEWSLDTRRPTTCHLLVAHLRTALAPGLHMKVSWVKLNPMATTQMQQAVRQ